MILIGRIKWMSDESHPVLVSGDTEIRLDISRCPDVPLATDIEARIENGRLQSFRRLTASDRSPRKNVAWLLADDSKSAEAHARACKLTQDEWRRLSQGKWDVSVTPYVYPIDATMTYESFDWRAARNIIKDNHPEARHNHLAVSGGWSSGSYCGKAELGGDVSWTYPNCGWKTCVHELGHNFGLGHAGTPSRQYGETKTWMGRSGGGRDNLNAPQLLELGLIDPENIADIQRGDGLDAYLVQADTLPLAVPEGADKIAIAHGRGRVKSIAVSLHDGRVDIHRPMHDFSSGWRWTTLLASLDTGESWESDGVRVEVHSIGAVAHVGIDNGREPEQRPIPTYSAPDLPQFSGKNGIWRNPEWSGQGLHVRHLPDRNAVFTAWLTWRDYQPVWYWGVLGIERGAAQGVMRTWDEGLIMAGRATLYFDGDRGVFRYEHKGLFAMPLERLSDASEDALSGFWGMGGNRGLSIEKAGGRYVGYILGPEGWNLVEALDASIPRELTVYDISGGVQGIKADLEMISVGTIEIPTDLVALA